MDLNRSCSGGKHRRAVTLVWLAIILVALMAFAAMGVDMGRVKLTKTELQTAADASARSAAWVIPELQFDEGIDRATHLMTVNNAGGGAIGFDVDQEDLLYGIWWRNSRTFQPLYNEERVRANAVAIRGWRHTNRGNPLPMTFAAAIGVDFFDVGADAVARIRGGLGAGSGGFGIFGRDWVQANGNTLTDSYNSAQGPYDPYTAGDDGGVGTNGYIEVIGTADINGGARWGPDGDTDPGNDYLDIWPNADVTGWQAPLDEDIIFPPVTTPNPYNNQPLINAGLLETKGKWKDGIVLTGSASVTVPGGTPENPAVYYVKTLQMGGNTQMTIDGTVEFYVYGPVDLTGGISALSGAGSWPLPSNLKINVIGPGPVELGGGSELHAQIYAPDADIKIHGTSNGFGLFGGVIGKTVDILGNSAIHVDSNLEWPGLNEGLHVDLVH